MQRVGIKRGQIYGAVRRASSLDHRKADLHPGFPKSDRRTFLSALAGFGLTPGARKPKKENEIAYRFQTPECEVLMSVQHFENSPGKDFRFRDSLTNRGFCLSANGDEDRGCSLRFTGSMAVAVYHFFPRFMASAPVKLRERVVTIDHDARLAPRPPFERYLTIERDMASDIQAFGYSEDDHGQPIAAAKPTEIWSLLHQDLYLNDQTTPFLIVHWKHTLRMVSLLDVIPGEQTKLISS
jgi:hypothetical protein